MNLKCICSKRGDAVAARLRIGDAKRYVPAVRGPVHPRRGWSSGEKPPLCAAKQADEEDEALLVCVAGESQRAPIRRPSRTDVASVTGQLRVIFAANLLDPNPGKFR